MDETEKNPSVPAEQAKKHFRPLWQKIIIKTFQALGIIIILFIIYVGWFLSGRPVITTNYIDVANKMIKPAGADDSQNAGPYYEKAAKLIKSPNEQINEYLGRNLDEANETDIIQIRQWLDNNREALSLIEQGANKQYCWQMLESDPNSDNIMLSVLLPNLTEFRVLGRGLRWRAYLSAEDKQYEKAFEDLLTLYKFGKHQKGKVILVQSLFGTALEVLSMNTARTILSRHDDIGPQQLEFFYTNLQEIVWNENFVTDTSIEKFFMYDESQRCFTESHFGLEHIYLKRAIGAFDSDWQFLRMAVPNMSTAFHIFFCTYPGKQQTRQMADAFFDFWQQIAAKTPFELKGRDLEKESKSIIKGNFLLEVLAPAMQKVTILGWRNRTDIESTLAIIEIVRFKEEKGRLPDDLQELVTAGYLKSLPMDPFSNKPLVYRKTQNGWTLYSVGSDYIDNGGKPYEYEPGKYKLWPDVNGTDAVFWPPLNAKSAKITK